MEMENEKLMANCTKAVIGVVAAVMRHTNMDGRKKSFPDTPEVRRKVKSYAIQELTRRLNRTPFIINHCDICDAVRERLEQEGYLK